MTGDVGRETPPSDQGDEPGLYVSAGDEGAVDSRHGGNRPRPASDLGWGKITALMAWGFVVLAFTAGDLADVTNLCSCWSSGRRCPPSSRRCRTGGLGRTGISLPTI